MVDEDNLRLLLHVIGSEDEAPLATVLAGLDLEEAAAVEGVGRELAEELAADRMRDSGGLQEESVDFSEVFEVSYDGGGGGGGGGGHCVKVARVLAPATAPAGEVLLESSGVGVMPPHDAVSHMLVQFWADRKSVV